MMIIHTYMQPCTTIIVLSFKITNCSPFRHQGIVSARELKPEYGSAASKRVVRDLWRTGRSMPDLSYYDLR
jgi:hypothetical protein